MPNKLDKRSVFYTGHRLSGKPFYRGLRDSETPRFA